MSASSLVVLALAACGYSAAVTTTDVPAGYKAVYITSNVNTKFVIVPKAAKSGSTVVVQTRNDKPEQQWYVPAAASATSKIQLAGTTLCLDAGAKTNWKDMASIYVNDCADTADGQKWDIKADGRIAVAGSTECIDLQYMRATANNPVGLYACAGLNNVGAADKGINWPFAEVA